jgi:hypothetical protein
LTIPSLPIVPPPRRPHFFGEVLALDLRFPPKETQGLGVMQSAYVERLIRETDEARLREALLEATGEELLERAKAVAEGIEQRVIQVATQRLNDTRGH